MADSLKSAIQFSKETFGSYVRCHYSEISPRHVVLLDSWKPFQVKLLLTNLFYTLQPRISIVNKLKKHLLLSEKRVSF